MVDCFFLTIKIKQGVVEFLGYGSFVESDLAQFFQGMGLPFDNTTLIVGPYYPNGFLESELDIQYIMVWRLICSALLKDVVHLLTTTLCLR